jgi:hypothetical protein
MRILNVSPHPDGATAALQHWTRARRAIARDELTRDLLAELRRFRGEVVALRLSLERGRLVA